MAGFTTIGQRGSHVKFGRTSVAIALASLGLAGLAQQTPRPKPPVELDWNQSVSPTSQFAIALSTWPQVKRKALAQAVGDALAEGQPAWYAEQQRALAPSATVSSDTLGGSKLLVRVVQGPPADCGATGNCPTFIFRWVRRNWDLLLDAGPSQVVFVQPTTSHGLHDIVASTTYGATTSEVRLYKFNGKRFLPSGCWDATWAASKQPPAFAPCD